MSQRLFASLLALTMVLAGCAAAVPDGDGPGEEVSPLAQAPTEHQTSDETIMNDGVEVHYTVFRPAGSSNAPGQQVPVILHSHGWSGSRDTTIGDGFLRTLLDNGYGVVSIDMRGHGDSGGQARVHSVDHEIQDVIAIIDEIATWDWVALDATDDPTLGAIGGSYGGGYQLLTAGQDDRLDALAPEITWNDLPYALAPNGAIKSAWVDILYAAGTARADLHPFIHQSYAWGAATNDLPDGQLPGEPDAVGRFISSSPMSYPAAIDVPTLLVQGIPDLLFNLNQAVWNHQQINATGAEVKLVTHLGGHIINAQGTLGDAPLSAGLQPAIGPSPCADVDEIRLAWFDEHLKGIGDDGLPPVSIALEDGTCATGQGITDAVLGEPSEHAFTAGVPGLIVVPQGAPVASGYAGIQGTPGDVPSPLRYPVASGQTGVLAGLPHLSGTITQAGAGAIVYLSLVKEDGATGESHIVDTQTTPLRAGPDGVGSGSFELVLAGVGTALDSDDTLYLQVASLDTTYAHNPERAPGAVVLEDLELRLPFVEG